MSSGERERERELICRGLGVMGRALQKASRLSTRQQHPCRSKGPALGHVRCNCSICHMGGMKICTIKTTGEQWQDKAGTWDAIRFRARKSGQNQQEEMDRETERYDSKRSVD